MAGDVVQVIECLPNQCEVLSLNPVLGGNKVTVLLQRALSCSLGHCSSLPPSVLRVTVSSF
jgi:hypothetical protein